MTIATQLLTTSFADVSAIDTPRTAYLAGANHNVTIAIEAAESLGAPSGVTITELAWPAIAVQIPQAASFLRYRVVRGQLPPGARIWIAGEQSSVAPSPTPPLVIFPPVGDAAPEIEAALNNANGQNVIYMAPGAWQIDSPVRLFDLANGLDASNRVLIRDPQATVTTNIASPSASDAAFVTRAPPAIATTTFATNVVEGSNQIQSTAPILPGAIIYVDNTLMAAAYRVLAHTGGAPDTLTLDRGVDYPFLAGDTISEVAALPTNIRLLGQGSLTQGVAPIYINFAGGAFLCEADGFRFGTGGGTPTDAIAAITTAAFSCKLSDMYVDAEGATLNAGFGMLAENCDFVNLRAYNLNGATAIKMANCVNSRVTSCVGQGSLVGCGLFTDVGPGFPNKDCAVIGGVFERNNVNISLDNAVRTKVTDVSANYGSVNLMMNQFSSGECFDNVVENASLKGAQVYAFDIIAGAKRTNLRNIKCEGSDQIASISDGATIRGLSYPTASAAGKIGLELQAGAYEVKLLDSRIVMGPACFAINIHAGAKLDASDVAIVLGVGSVGVVGQAGAGAVTLDHFTATETGAATGISLTDSTVRLADAIDVSGVTTGISLGAGFSSQGSVVSNGTGAAQAIAWPDLRATDDIDPQRTLNGGAPGVSPTIAKTPGTGFSLTFAAGDTSTYSYRVFP